MFDLKSISLAILLLLQCTNAFPTIPQNQNSATKLFSRAGTERLCFAPKAGRIKPNWQAKSPSTSNKGSSKKYNVGRSIAGLDSTGLAPNTTTSDHSDLESSVPQVQRRIPFGTSLPPVDDDPSHNLRRINQILRDGRTTPLFSNAGAYSNSHSFSTSADQQLGTTTGGLAGCTIVVSHTKDHIYISHHWEIPGFNKFLPDYPKIMFEPEVMGFLTGQPNNYGTGEPLVVSGAPSEAQKMSGAFTHIITPGASRGFKAPSYRAKVESIEKLTTERLRGKSKVFPYQRPNEDQDVVRVTVEFCTANKHLRVMISDNRSGDYGGTRVFDAAISE